MRLLITTLFLCVINVPLSASAKAIEPPLPAPEFAQQDHVKWLSCEPLRPKLLRGKVILLNFWAFDCWNCYLSYPWRHQLKESLADSPFQL